MFTFQQDSKYSGSPSERRVSTYAASFIPPYLRLPRSLASDFPIGSNDCMLNCNIPLCDVGVRGGSLMLFNYSFSSHVPVLNLWNLLVFGRVLINGLMLASVSLMRTFSFVH